VTGRVDHSRRITLVAPRGTLVVRAPLDVPVAELMPELVAVAATGNEDDVGNGWVLCAADGKPLAPAATLGDCGLPDDAVLELHAPDGTGKPSGAAGTGDRPLSARNATVLPARLSTIQRLRRATLALASPSAPRPPAVATSMTLTAPPEVFTLAARPSLAVRVRDAWARSDYGRQLDERILAPRLRRCATIAVVSPKGGVGKTFITALLGSLLEPGRVSRSP
jgi:hypothetical protein